LNKKGIKIFELLVSLAITFGFLYLFYKVIGIGQFLRFFLEINPLSILTAFILYTGSYVTRAFRWKIVLSIKQFKKLFKITAFNTVFNIFLPFRTGELSFFYMLKKENIPLSETAVSFFSVRIFDAISLFSVFGVSFFLFMGNPLLSILVFLIAPFSFFGFQVLLRLIKHEKVQEFEKTNLF